MSDSGLVDIEGHTVTHADLPQLTDAQLTAELVNSKQDLESHLGKEIRYLAYPNGDYDLRVQQTAWQAGYGAAVAAWGGVELDSANKWALKRMSVVRDTTVDQLLAMISTAPTTAVQMVGTSISTSQARDGQTIQLGYEITNNTGASVATTLDASLTDSANQVLLDPGHLTTVTVSPGTGWYFRDYWINVPPSPAAGAYNVGYTIHQVGAADQSVSLPSSLSILAPIAVQVPILMYHHVGYGNEVDGVYPEQLRAQLLALKANGYTFITFTDLMQMRAGELPIPAKPVMLTFDDGYADQYVNMLPILQEVGAKATAFIFTQGVSTDPVIMTWQEVKAMSDSGLVDVEAHTVTHPYLTQLTDAQLTAELVNSKQDLESHLGKEIRYLAYPYGDYDARVEQAAWQAGYGAAVAAWGGVELDSANKWALKRMSVLRATTVDQLLAMI
jgi:peptidoglycan/xylan/chitin deacetylase (PgdA/CDA1 family)